MSGSPGLATFQSWGKAGHGKRAFLHVVEMGLLGVTGAFPTSGVCLLATVQVRKEGQGEGGCPRPLREDQSAPPQLSQLPAWLCPNELHAGWSPSVQPAGPQRPLQ